MSGHFQHQWSRFELELSESSAFPSPVRIRLGDNIKNAEAEQLDQGPGKTLVSDDPIDCKTSDWVLEQ
jgi:hypothetical protein